MVIPDWSKRGFKINGTYFTYQLRDNEIKKYSYSSTELLKILKFVILSLQLTHMARKLCCHLYFYCNVAFVIDNVSSLHRLEHFNKKYSTCMKPGHLYIKLLLQVICFSASSVITSKIKDKQLFLTFLGLGQL